MMAATRGKAGIAARAGVTKLSIQQEQYGKPTIQLPSDHCCVNVRAYMRQTTPNTNTRVQTGQCTGQSRTARQADMECVKQAMQLGAFL